MAKQELIAIHEFCVSHNVERSFIYSLYEAGLVEMTTIEETVFISDEQVPELEKLVRLHYDMDINLEGIETIHHLLQQLKTLQKEMKELRSRLSLYEQTV